MKKEKNCRTCAYYVCARKECNINNMQGCKHFKSIIQEAIEVIDKCNEEGKVR